MELGFLVTIIFSIAMSVIKMAVVGIATVTIVIALVKVASMLRVNQQRRPVEEEEKDEGVMV